ncbi:hypothetical protein [Rubinisphaera sp. JC750]|uniref:hypothetical protein n=1 Tax=Rubinisphaera sp. JC750 TaxID=2898658 RepID=UPI001F1C3E52|nr:hypothetical protein [Rubinisphaera sp. JC750]
MTALSRFCLIASLLLLPACQQQPEESAAPTPASIQTEFSLQEQLERIHSGKSTEIVLESTPVSADEFRQLSEVADQLTRLDLEAVTLDADNQKLLARFTQLDRLKLGAPVDDATLKQIGELQVLRIVNLPNGQFTDDGLKELAGLPKLELLRFSSPHVTDAGLSVVKELPALRFVHLIDVPITDAGLKHLHDVDTLESFYLDGGQTTDEGLRDLLAAHPELHLHKDQLHLPGDPQSHEH